MRYDFEGEFDDLVAQRGGIENRSYKKNLSQKQALQEMLEKINTRKQKTPKYRLLAGEGNM